MPDHLGEDMRKVKNEEEKEEKEIKCEFRSILQSETSSCIHAL